MADADEGGPDREPGPGPQDPATPEPDAATPRRRGRHVGRAADARRATRPGTREPAHAAAPAEDPAPARVGDPAPVLPRSPDESDLGWGRPDGDDDEWLRREVPPHW